MSSLTPRERRTVIFASTFTGLYLAIFFGAKGVAWLEERRTAALSLRSEVEAASLAMVRERAKIDRLDRLRETSGIDRRDVSPETVVGAARMAILDALKTCGLPLGTSRETRSPGGREIGRIHLESAGPVASVLRFVDGAPRLGYPLAVDRLSFDRDQKQPGLVHLVVDFIVLDPRAWVREAAAAREASDAES